MSNFEKANETIYRVLNPQYGDFAVPTDAVQALADAGLLAPDLPDADEEKPDHQFKSWTNSDLPVIAASPNVVMVRGLGLFDAAEARGLFLRLGAAFQHAEKGN